GEVSATELGRKSCARTQVDYAPRPPARRDWNATQRARKIRSLPMREMVCALFARIVAAEGVRERQRAGKADKNQGRPGRARAGEGARRADPDCSLRGTRDWSRHGRATKTSDSSLAHRASIGGRRSCNNQDEAGPGGPRRPDSSLDRRE
ncbi:hypothetical protein LCGC14_3015580, partial [marine sediment metagenome]